MRNRKLALVLSFLCPGLGQLCKGEVLKGLCFMAICAILIGSVFFLSNPVLLYRLGIAAIVLMWLVNLVDAYIDDEFMIERNRLVSSRRALVLLPLFASAFSIVILLLIWAMQFSDEYTGPSTNAALNTPPDDISPIIDTAHYTNNEANENSEYFTIQVAAFRTQKKADEVCQQLLGNGYAARTETDTSNGTEWRRIMVGKFAVEQDAIEFMDKLKEQKDFLNMVIRRRSHKSESGSP